MANLLAGIGQARPVSDFINVAGQYQMQQSSLENQRLQRQMLQQQQDQLAKDNAEYDVDAALSLYPEQDRPFIKQALTMAGKIRPDGMVIGKDMREVPKLFEAYPKVAIGRGTMEYDSLAKENEKLAKKGDEQSQQQMLANAQRMTQIKKDIAALSGKEGTDKDFTLGEGQKRFDESGKEIAAVPKVEEQWSDPAPMVIDGKTVMTQKSSKTGEMKTVAQGASPAVQINFDKKTIEGVISGLPKKQDKANNSVRGLHRINQMLDLLEKGAGGRIGQVKAWLAPNLEMLGIKSKGLSDAQLYNTLARTLGGSFRIEIVGPGQVSDYENRLLQAISGGGGTATDAARELLQYYKTIAQTNISDYNAAVDSVSKESPSVPKVYPKIGETSTPKTIKYDANGNRLSQ